MYILTNDLLLLTDSDKRQTRPLVREGAPYGQDSNFHTRINIWGSTPRLTVSCNVTLTLEELQCLFP
jgi:hypothetical protein